jgi:hypothetical protein
MKCRVKITLYSFIITSILSVNALYCQEQLEVDFTHACFYFTNQHPKEVSKAATHVDRQNHIETINNQSEGRAFDRKHSISCLNVWLELLK